MYEICNKIKITHFIKIWLIDGVSRYRNKGGHRGGGEVAEVADVEEVVEAGIFGPSHRRRHRVGAEVVDVVGVAEVVDASNAGK